MLLGSALEQDYDLKALLVLLHPEYRERVPGQIRLFNDRASVHHEMTGGILRADAGQLRWLKWHVLAHFGADGQAMRFVGTVLDITEHKLRCRAKCPFIIDHCHFVRCDHQQNTGKRDHQLNDAAQRIFGCASAEVIEGKDT